MKFSLKDLFRRKQIPTKTKDNGEVSVDFIYSNDTINITHRAARICYGLEPKATFEDKIEHLSRIICNGHQSVAEHSNIIMLITLDEKAYIKLTPDFITGIGKFMNMETKVVEDKIYILIGGSTRAYQDIFLMNDIKSVTDNLILDEIRNILYRESYSFFFNELCNSLVFNRSEFDDDIEKLMLDDENNIIINELPKNPPKKTNKHYDSSITVVNIDNLDYIFNRLKYIMEDNVFSVDTLFKFATTSIVFEKLSRSASDQLNRHRNAISMQSQRYVDSSSHEFINPLDYKIEFKDVETDAKYDIHTKYINDSMTLKEIGNTMIEVYSQLVEQGLTKEDARSILPMNVESKEIMTFTLSNLSHFVKLRTRVGVQAEIRSKAIDVKILINELLLNFTEIEPPLIEEYLYSKLERSIRDMSNKLDLISEEI